MSIDPATGQVAFPALTVGPGTTRGAFLGSPLAEGAKEEIKHEAWCSYALPRQRFSGREFAAVLRFEGERLTDIELMDTNPRFGTSWDDWSEAKELARKEEHDHWLTAALERRPPWEFSWGTVSSGYDPRSGASDIAIRYREAGRPSSRSAQSALRSVSRFLGRLLPRAHRVAALRAAEPDAINELPALLLCDGAGPWAARS